MTVCLPYNYNLFYSVKNALKSYNINVIAKPNYILSNIIKRGKDMLSKFEQTNKEYQLKCKDCDASYVGETKREINIRLVENFNNWTLDPEKYNVITKIVRRVRT